MTLKSHELRNIPDVGPFVLAVKHYHHLYDGAVLYKSIGRPFHIFVALDWAPNMMTRISMETLCAIAGWPVGLRSVQGETLARAYRPSERIVYLRRAFATSSRHLREGRGVVFFPEGAPVVDPHKGKATTSAFSPGLCVAVEFAQVAQNQIPIIPVGLSYTESAQGYHVALRCGLPIYHADRRHRAATMDMLAQEITRLSLPDR